jgi:GDP-L-fucose synthase
MDRDSVIYVAGHGGLVGSAILRCLESQGYTRLITRTHGELDLERQGEVEDFFEHTRPTHVFLAAAKVGGIWANYTRPAEFIYRNLAIQTNVIHASWKTGVKRLLFLGSSCIYPREAPQPLREEYILGGPLEHTNQPYAVAKIAGVVQCEAYNRQYGTNYLCVMPTNVYGPNDNFDLESCHVLPALLRKFHLAKLASCRDWDAIRRDERCFGPIPKELKATLGINAREDAGSPRPGAKGHEITTGRVILWGSGTPRREFLHVDDLADACVYLMKLPKEKFAELCRPPSTEDAIGGKKREGALPIINVGCGRDRTVRELAEMVASIVGFEGEIIWDMGRPDGTPRKLLDVSRMEALGWRPKISLEEGIRSTYEWYRSQTSTQPAKDPIEP